MQISPGGGLAQRVARPIAASPILARVPHGIVAGYPHGPPGGGPTVRFGGDLQGRSEGFMLSETLRREGPLILALVLVGAILGGLLVGYEPVGGDPDRMYRPLKSELARALG